MRRPNASGSGPSRRAPARRSRPAADAPEGSASDARETAAPGSRSDEVVLLHGEERFLADEKARSLLDAWRAALVSDFGFELLEGVGLAPARLQDAVLQAPFLDPHRVVQVRALPPNRADSFAATLKHIPATTRLVVTVSGRLGPANKLTRAIVAAGGKVEEMPHLRGRQLADWVNRRAVERHGLTPAVAAQVVRVTPADLGVIDSELTKLSAYKASGAKLSSETVVELLAGGREDEIFKLTDNLLPSPSPHAFQVARGLTRGGMQPTSIAYRIARHIALVLEVSARRQRGETLQQVQEGIPEHRFVVQKAFDAAQDADPARLERALNQIRDYEWEVKSGQVDAELGLEVLLARL